MPFNIADGSYTTEAPALLLPLDASGIPGVAPVTAVSGLLTPADQGGVRDLTGERLQQLAAYETDIAAAMHAGMSAEDDRRSGYHDSILPTGASYGDQPDLPVVPEDATPPAQSDLYPSGDQPGN